MEATETNILKTIEKIHLQSKELLTLRKNRIKFIVLTIQLFKTFDRKRYGKFRRFVQ